MLNIIVAPYEENPNGEKYAKKIVKYLKVEQVEYSVYFSINYESVKENVKDLISCGENEFVIVGDDVMISTVISSIKDLNKAKIGIIPTSKNDDFASYLKISTNPIQAIKDILLKNIASVDLMIVNDLTVLNTVVVGASVEVFHMYNQYKMKNFISEKYATTKYGNNFSGIDLVFENKTKSKKETVFELVVANGGYSKGKPVSPLSNLQDGLFNVNYTTVSTKPSKKKYIKMFNNGEHIYDEDTKQHWMTNLKITNPDKKIKALIDGKIYNLEELNISILENGLKLYKRP
ncbi:MAG: hypothetical protein IJ415_03325 [Clostridia bacterium]|nr:hypothetical protein [Clostridia bacterium]